MKSMSATYLVHLDNNVIPLASLNPQDLCLIGNNWSEISADDFHLMVVEVHSIGRLSRTDY